jgi:hypothetical protein
MGVVMNRFDRSLESYWVSKRLAQGKRMWKGEETSGGKRLARDRNTLL